MIHSKNKCKSNRPWAIKYIIRADTDIKILAINTNHQTKNVLKLFIKNPGE